MIYVNYIKMEKTYTRLISSTQMGYNIHYVFEIL